MARQYVIRAGETLSLLAKRFYDDPALGVPLALFNGIRDPNLIVVGQTIEIPPRRELDGADRPEPPAGTELVPPHGLDEIRAVFGDPFDYMRDDGTVAPEWEVEFLTRTPLPFAIPIAGARSKQVKRLQCHKKLQDLFPAVLSDIQQAGLHSHIVSCGGCYNFRLKRTSGKLSVHSWGIAIDLNTETNKPGTAGNMDEGVVAAFRARGFTWGGTWSGTTKDPMHFQFCTGY